MKYSGDITITYDLEDHRPDKKYECRYPQNTEIFLEYLGQKNAKATFFIVGDVAETKPELVRTIADKGHEIASHSYKHIPLTKVDAREFKSNLEKSKHQLEDLISKPVIGFRAPIFSLTPSSLWAVDCLNELGFKYSSSILPSPNPLFGFPDLPKTPFKWPNGLLEIPVPIANFGPLQIPFTGGVYLRYLPFTLIQKFYNKLKGQQELWTYSHPYDYDDKESFFCMKDTSFLVSLILWYNRKNTYKRLSKLCEFGISDTFASKYESDVYSKAEPITLNEN